MTAAKVPQIINGLTSWHCASCDLWYEAAAFHKDKHTSNGLAHYCCHCVARRHRDRRERIQREKRGHDGALSVKGNMMHLKRDDGSVWQRPVYNVHAEWVRT